jgi:hypothetical protein
MRTWPVRAVVVTGNASNAGQEVTGVTGLALSNPRSGAAYIAVRCCLAFVTICRLFLRALEQATSIKRNHGETACVHLPDRGPCR